MDKNSQTYAEDDSENVMLRKKLRLKIDALQMLSQELDKCRAQRDQFKLMAEQIQERYIHLKKQIGERRNTDRSYGLSEDYQTLESLLETREQNKSLRLQVETLRQKLSDALADIKVLRSCNKSYTESLEMQDAPVVHQREEMIEQLEKLNIKCRQLETDLQTVLDEKHELEIERDAFKCKAHRLNHELSKALNASNPMDIDGLINENRYLQERLQQLLEEKELSRQSLSKYKSMLDSKRLKGSIKLGANAAAGVIMTHKQVEQLLQQCPRVSSQKSTAAVSDLHGLCAALLEALNDKTLALTHQKRANKILAARICELDSTIQSPTAKLIEGYTNADVDTQSDQDFTRFENSLEGTWSNDEDKIINVKVSNSDEEVAKERASRALKSFQSNLPENLSILVEKALFHLQESEKQKL